MSIIEPTHGDYRYFLLDLEKIIQLQERAEDRGFGTRWSSVDALRGQVQDAPILAAPFAREERAGEIRAYRLLVLFRRNGHTSPSSGVVTLDVDPVDYFGMEERRLSDRVLAFNFLSLASSGIEMLSKD